MRVPEALSIISCLRLSISFLQIILCWLSFEFLEFRPSVFEDLYGEIESIYLSRTNISDIVSGG